MATHPDVLELVTILDEEGFGVIAGELLAEINLGRETEVKHEAVQQTDGADDEGESDVIRKTIPMDEQLQAAMAFLRDRLVDPIRAFAEAEEIVAEISKQTVDSIRFIDARTRETTFPDLTTVPRDISAAEKLDDLLERLPTLTIPPQAPRV